MAGIVSYVAHPSLKQTQIVETLCGRIIAGRLAPGDQLPTVDELGRQFGTSRVTVQRAIAHLRDHGYLYTRLREGTYVSENPPHLSNFALVVPEAHSRAPQFFVALESEAHLHFENASGPLGVKRTISVFKQIRCAPDDVLRAHHQLIEQIGLQKLAGMIFTGPFCEFNNTPVLCAPDLPG